ncbi:hypothetical protein LTR37_010512 [Vermiconidia calcicola]|uniref:Uncharacterized protein n=1 Tax=Vermiconidia calcicola TaxID=1690605 RepID=A0ACC3N5A9_9PEZI|nr:hypothetical protein LTR37_010512 [Vermiconidia calcicola]
MDITMKTIELDLGRLIEPPLALLFIGMVTAIMVSLSWQLSDLAWVSATFLTEVTKADASVQKLRPYAQAIPSCVWTHLTWTLFAFGYFAGAMREFPSTSILMMHSGGLATLVAVLAYQTCLSDFKAFVDLGPGGTPSTWHGFKRVTLLAWFGRINVIKAPIHRSGQGFLLQTLPLRLGERPTVGGIAPQRQIDQRNTGNVYGYLLKNLHRFATENKSHLRTGTSFLEKKGKAIFAHCDCVDDPLFRTFGCEIMHPHPIDGSLHVMLHPDDIATVIAAGWGERHPIARANAWWLWWFFTFEERPPVPESLCFIYAPRTHIEVDTVMHIVEAGSLFVANGEAGNGDDHLACPNHRPRLVRADEAWTVSLGMWVCLRIV